MGVCWKSLQFFWKSKILSKEKIYLGNRSTLQILKVYKVKHQHELAYDSGIISGLFSFLYISLYLYTITM